jgi:hypothetical protein
MAFADEATTQDQQDQQLINIVDGVPQDDEGLKAQSFSHTYGPRNVSMMFMVNPYSVNAPRYVSNNNRNQVRNVWVGDVSYAPSVANYRPYTGQMNINWYAAYAKNVLNEVKTALNKEQLDKAEKEAAIAKINAAIASIDAATSYNAINGYLDGVYGYVTGCPWNSRINWGNYFTTDKYGRWRRDCYLPNDWDWRWDCRNYDCSYTPSDAAKAANVYRLVNGKGVHVYVNSTAKYNEFAAAGWDKEGKCFNSLTTSSKPVYQLYNDANVYTYALTAEAYEALAGRVGTRTALPSTPPTPVPRSTPSRTVRMAAACSPSLLPRQRSSGPIPRGSITTSSTASSRLKAYKVKKIT